MSTQNVDPINNPKDIDIQSPPRKKKHGCLKLFLILLAVAVTAAVVFIVTDDGKITSVKQAIELVVSVTNVSEETFSERFSIDEPISAVTKDGQQIFGYSIFPVTIHTWYEPVSSFIITQDGSVYFKYTYDMEDRQGYREYSAEYLTRKQPSPPQDISVYDARLYLASGLGIPEDDLLFLPEWDGNKGEIKKSGTEGINTIFYNEEIIEGFYFMHGSPSSRDNYLVAYDGTVYYHESNGNGYQKLN